MIGGDDCSKRMFQLFLTVVLLLLQPIQGWAPGAPPARGVYSGLPSSRSGTSSSLLEKEARLKSQDLPPEVDALLQRIPPSTVYKSGQLKEAHSVMLSLLQQQQDDNNLLSPRILHDAVTYYMDTLHAVCHEILGHVHISLARDVYKAVGVPKRPYWCRCMYEILQTDLDTLDSDAVMVLQDWVECTSEPFEVREYLKESQRLDLWEELRVPIPVVSKEGSVAAAGTVDRETLTTSASSTNGKTITGSNTSITSASFLNGQTANGTILGGSTETSLQTEEQELPSDPHELFLHLAGKVDTMISQDRINSTLYYKGVYSAIGALQNICMDASEEELRSGLWVASTALLRRDATWIFRLLDQRGLVKRDDVYHLLHVYCNDHRRPFCIQFALSMLSYCEEKAGKNAYIRRPDPLMYRMVLKSIGEYAAYGFGHRALQVMKCMSQRAKSDAENVDESWKPVFDDHASAVSAFIDDSPSWPSVQRADGLVRSLYYNSEIGQRAGFPPPQAIQQLTKVGHKLRIVPLPPQAQGPLYKVLEAYKDEKTMIKESDDAMRRVEASVSLFEFALEQTALGNGTLEELSKYHFFLVIEHCKRTNTRLAQECVRIFSRVDQLVGQGLLSQDLVSPSVSFQILSLLAADKSPGHSSAAVRILDHYISRTQETRLAAFQYAIQCCCYENCKSGTQLAVTLIERAARTFRRKPFRDSFFVEALQQIELHCPTIASKVLDVLNFKMYTNPLDVDSRIAILMSLYRCLRRDDASAEKVKSIVARLEKLRAVNPDHPAFASGECLVALQVKEAAPAVEQRQPTYAIDILLSSKEAGDIVMAESILEQGETDGTPHDVHTYQRIVEAFIGNNDMSAATRVLRRMKSVHSRDACIELETNVFDILLSSGQSNDLQLAESMMSWSNYERSDLANMCTKIVYTYLSLSNGRVGVQGVLKLMNDRLDEDFLTKLREVFVDTEPNGASIEPVDEGSKDSN